MELTKQELLAACAAALDYDMNLIAHAWTDQAGRPCPVEAIAKARPQPPTAEERSRLRWAVQQALAEGMYPECNDDEAMQRYFRIGREDPDAFLERLEELTDETE